MNARGARGNDPGSGVEAGLLMKEHIGEKHGKTWGEYLHARLDALSG